MKRLLNFLLICWITLFAANLYAAEAVLTYNPDRVGEGAAIFIEGETAVITFYTFLDASIIYPPTVSPYIPPKTVTPSCLNTQAWYVGIATNWNGKGGSGDMYIDIPFEYPYPVGVEVSESVKIGEFVLVRDREGFDFYVDWVDNSALPWSISLYDTVYQLWLPLIRVKSSE